MPIATWADLDLKVGSPHELLPATKLLSGDTTQRWNSEWLATPNAGVAPTTAAVPTRATAGALGQQDGTGLRVVRATIGSGATGVAILCDRLSHQGGLVGNVATAQTTNLPTAALTRYTTGVGVFLGLEIYTQIGTTGTTVTASYTDQDGNTGQTTIAHLFGAAGPAGSREARRMVWLPLASGDSGVRAVASVTLAATTGTAGNFGVTLFKPLLAIPLVGRIARLPDPILGDLMGGLPEILTDACLFWQYMPTVAITAEALILQPTLALAED